MKKSVQKGFTIIELVVVIVILGILAAVAFPKFNDLSTNAEGAVISGAVAALKSSAVILYAKNSGSKSGAAAIIAATELDNVTAATTATACQILVTKGASSTSFIVSTEYCS